MKGQLFPHKMIFLISQRGTAFYCLDSYLLMMFDGIRQWRLQVFISPDDNDEDDDDDDEEDPAPRQPRPRRARGFSCGSGQQLMLF